MAQGLAINWNHPVVQSGVAREFWWGLEGRRAEEKERALLVSDDLVGLHLDLLPPCWYNPLRGISASLLSLLPLVSSFALHRTDIYPPQRSTSYTEMAMFGNGATSDDFLSFNFPTTALASFDDDFLSLLQKHTKPLVNPQQAPSNNPATLSTFPNPTITPPSSGTDESPSPPSVNTAQDNLSRNPSSSAIAQPPMSARTTRSSNRDSQSDILGKRKAPYIIDDDDDDDLEEDHPPHKQLHTDASGEFPPFIHWLPLTVLILVLLQAP